MILKEDCLCRPQRIVRLQIEKIAQDLRTKIRRKQGATKVIVNDFYGIADALNRMDHSATARRVASDAL